MTGEPVPPARGAFGEEPAWGRPFPPAVAPLVQGLERLRERVRERLDQIEALARDRAAVPEQTAETSERERVLHQRLAELEDAQRRQRVEADRWEKERQAAAEQLEHDRRLLAEAWERLEREQVEAPATAHAPPRRTPADRPATAVVRAAIPADHDDPVAQAILKQFQTLRRDVRRNANGPCSG